MTAQTGGMEVAPDSMMRRPARSVNAVRFVPPNLSQLARNANEGSMREARRAGR